MTDKQQAINFNEWNPRYSMYARSRGMTEDEMLATDEANRPSACILDFILFIQEKWQAWRAENKIPANYPLSREHHVAFDAWLEKYTNNHFEEK